MGLQLHNPGRPRTGRRIGDLRLKGHIWIGTGAGGVSRYNGERMETFTEADELAGSNVRKMMLDRRGKLWSLGADGVSRFEGERFVPFEKAECPGVKRWGWSMVEDRRGHLWFGTNEGVVRYDGRQARRSADGENRVTVVRRSETGFQIDVALGWSPSLEPTTAIRATSWGLVKADAR